MTDQATSAGAVAVRFSSVSRAFDDFLAVRELSFSLRRGRLMAFLGPNGAGKSTSIRMLLGLEAPTTGRIEVLGGHPRDQEVRRRMGYTSQDLNFPPHLSGKEILTWIAQHFPRSLSLAKLREQFGLETILAKRLVNLSGGERRRIGLAAAFVGLPDLVILDEPTTGLDLDAKELLWTQLKTYRDLGGTVLLCTHDLDEVEKVADDVLLLERGECLFTGTLKDALDTIDYHKVSYTLHGQRWVELTKESDHYLRRLLQDGSSVSDILVERASLEEAFRTLRAQTGDKRR